ncbi:MAG: type VI secretion system tip protein VgrG [Cocleimonas sp.]|nr:type VI secretion system tip protein VgrG [Cocleimonas sp.]
MPKTPTQTNRELEFISPLGKDVLLLHSFKGTEQLGRLFQFDLELRSTQEDIDFEALLGKNVAIRLNTSPSLIDAVSGAISGQGGGFGERYFNGYITDFEQGENAEGFATYKATVSPWLWFLERTNDCRIFQEQDVVEIIQSVFEDNEQTGFELRLSNSYRKREYTVQYRESDFNFVSRLMEEEGIYYFFEHEKESHKLIICDSYASHEMIPAYDGIPYYPPDATTIRHEDIINQWSHKRSVRSGAFAMNDYDFKNSRSNIKNESNRPKDHDKADAEVYDYPGKYITHDEGGQYAKMRQEEMHASYALINGGSTAREFSAGKLMKMAKHPRADQNIEYLIIEVIHDADQDAFGSTKKGASGYSYKNTFKVIESHTPFRTQSTAIKSKVEGTQHAHVTGPKGEEIYCDEYGRVKVQFPWDRYGKSDENSSCWIRVSQNWAGGNWGHMAIPRIGQEVIVDFYEGNPDRPIITGRTYNDATKVPYPLPANKTRMTIKSKTHKGTGYNELRFEDEKDQEEVFIHAQKDQNNVVEHNETTRVGNDRTENIGNDETISIGHDRTESVGNDETISIGHDQANTIGNDQNNHVIRNRISHIGKDEIIKADNHRKLDVYADQYITTGGHHTHKVEGKAELKAGKKISQKTKIVDIGAEEKAVIIGPNGTITIDSSGITLKGNVTVKGTISVSGGGGGGAGAVESQINKGKPLNQSGKVRTSG